MNKIQELLFEEKYRPVDMSGICLPENLKNIFRLMIEKKEIPNLILNGYTGIGKTTIAKILVNETDSEYLFINGSENRGIDTLRTDIKDFVSTVSINNLPKIVIIDEADNLSAQTLAAMRGFIEEHNNNARFIFTTESIDKFPKAIISRLKNIEFRFDKEGNKDIISQYLRRLIFILKKEGIDCKKFELEILVEFIRTNFPNLRLIMVELQKHLIFNQNKINEGLLKSKSDKVFDELCVYLKNGDFTKIRHLLKNEINEDSLNYYKLLYENIDVVFKSDSIPDAVIILGEYMYRDNIHRSKEVNFASCCAQLMKLKFK